MEGQLRRLILALLIVDYIAVIVHLSQTIQFENEARLQLENNVLMHWMCWMCILRQYRKRRTLIILQDCNMLMFNPNNVSCDCSWFRSRSQHVLTTNEPHQSLFVTGARPRLQEGLGLVVLVCTRVRLLCSHLPKRTALRGQTNLSLIEPNQTGQVWKHP